MNCLNECSNDVLNYFISKADSAVPLYMCAEEQYPKWNAIHVCEACEELMLLGLLVDVGQASKVYKLSASAMGDVLNGQISSSDEHTQESITELVGRLQKLEKAQRRPQGATQPTGKGGLAPAEHQPAAGGKGKGKDAAEE